jgi:trimethylamine:corrinoid methyltransferase-like protein
MKFQFDGEYHVLSKEEMDSLHRASLEILREVGVQIPNARVLEMAAGGVFALGNARIGDKTLVDTLAPALDAFRAEVKAGRSFTQALSAMTAGAERGRSPPGTSLPGWGGPAGSGSDPGESWMPERFRAG